MKSVKLTEKEATLQELLLNVAGYIATRGRSKPELRWTGGWVRDKLLGVTSHDIDVAINNTTGYDFGVFLKEYAEHQRLHSHIKIAKINENPEKSKHLQTATTKILGLDLDLVNLRKEVYTNHSRNPQVEFGTPQEDALRRDATVNALFYNLQTSEIEDFTGRGLQDIDRKLLITPLPPFDTFMDDPLRVLRLIRFAGQLGYSIDDEVMRAIDDPKVKEALMNKVSRERVGIEIEKMLKGPDPYGSLKLIDRLALYETIFSTFEPLSTGSPRVENWNSAYEQLRRLLTFESDQQEKKTLPDNSAGVIRQVLTGNSQDFYHLWLLSALVPWARVAPSATTGKGSKAKEPAAVIAARAGIMANNAILQIIRASAASLEDIISVKEAVNREQASPSSERRVLVPEMQGMAVRRWGSSWRSSVLFALLTQIMETDNEKHSDLLDGYATWLSAVADLGVMDAWKLKPIITGKRLASEVQSDPGPWLGDALENIVIPWQLRNPGVDDQEAVIEEVKRRRMNEV
ncbi:MAG: hypothetical protein LQ342_000786 [Letrouitia transgressa]|nr:MAG: hypothetical protein LQ342_000786 [Letrouitia transgressa]